MSSTTKMQFYAFWACDFLFQLGILVTPITLDYFHGITHVWSFMVSIYFNFQHLHLLYSSEIDDCHIT